MTLSMFGNFDKGTVVLMALAVIVGAYLLWLERREKKAKAGVCEQYATLTEETLTALPDEELVRAVVANVVKKQESKVHLVSIWRNVFGGFFPGARLHL
jgi:hypothetical protein